MRELTDEELEELAQGALNQLADSVREYEEAKHAYNERRPSQQLAVQRLNTAKDSVRTSIYVYDDFRAKIAARYNAGNPV